MEKYEINGGRKLDGKVKIESAKNAVLPILAASLLTKEEVIVKNCPKIDDVINMLKVLEELGSVYRFENKDLVIKSENLKSGCESKILTKKLRSSVLTVGAILARLKEARIYLPGGCDIGARPVDYHVSALESIGATVSEEDGVIVCKAEKLTGKRVELPFPSVGATENLMIASSVADGVTEIINPAREPEIEDLARFINSMGGKIVGAGSGRITVEGVKTFHGSVYKPISDRIELGTFLIATAITGGNVEFENAQIKNIYALIGKLCENSCKISVKNDIIHITCESFRKPFSLETGPYPSFPTDLQPQSVALALNCDGCSVIKETVFERRFAYTDELLKMGGRVKLYGNTAFVYKSPLHGAKVKACDLRGGAALVLAGLSAEGKTEIFGAEHVKRGYLNLEEKLSGLGAFVKAVKTEE